MKEEMKENAWKRKINLSKNAHPNIDGSPWGWIVFDGTRTRIATYSGYAEQEYAEEVKFRFNKFEEMQSELTTLRSRVKELEKYAYHKNGCDLNTFFGTEKVCTCGLDNLLNPTK